MNASWLMTVIFLCSGLALAAGLMFFHSRRRRDPWAGRLVMLKFSNIEFGHTNADGLFVSAGELDTSTVKVTQHKDGWLATTHRGQSGWFPAAYAVALAEAPAYYSDLIRRQPDLAWAWGNRGVAWVSLNKPAQALADFDEAVRLDVYTPTSLIARGLVRNQLEDYREAVDDFTAALRIDPDNAAAFAGRGFARAMLKQHILALTDLEMASRRDPQNAHAPLGRAQVWSARKDYAQARAELEKARQLGPEDFYVLNCLAWFAATCPDAAYRDGPRAVADATRAGEKTLWKAGSMLDTLAAAYAETGQFDKALETQKKALAKPDDFPKKELEKARQRLKLYMDGKPYRKE